MAVKALIIRRVLFAVRLRVQGHNVLLLDELAKYAFPLFPSY